MSAAGGTIRLRCRTRPMLCCGFWTGEKVTILTGWQPFSGLDGAALLPRLLELELQQLLVRSSAGRFSRFRG